jgi:hypothetical protein
MSIRFYPNIDDINEIGHIVNSNIHKITMNSKLIGQNKFDNWQKEVSEEKLKEIISDEVPVAILSNMTNFSNLGVTNKICHVVQRMYPENTIMPSGYFHYHNTGFMGWHTNSDSAGKRIYITWAKEADKSFFRYKMGSEIITDYDDIGLSFRTFDVSENPPYLWHCVGSSTDRLSFGFRIL